MPLFTIPALPQSQIGYVLGGMKVDVAPYAEARERFERRIDKDFDASINDDRTDLFTRWRLGAKLAFGKQWRGELQFQFAHDAAWTKARNFSTENRDLGLAYAEGSIGGWTLDIGRQKINIGQQRLIGSFDWNNVGRSFDAIRVRNKQWDAFGFKIGMASPRPRDARVAGLVHMASYGDTMLVFKHDKGGVDITTLDQNFSRAFGAVLFDAEGALQWGRVAGNDQRAWAVHARAATKVGAGRAYAEVNSASGGPNRTFDNLYPTNHAKYGIADMIAWKNMDHVAAGYEFSPRKDLSVKASWNHYSLRDPRDAWYGAGGSPNTHAGNPLKDPTGLSGRELGSEYDLDANFTLSKRYSLAGGVALFKPGSFVENVTGHKDTQYWAYLQFTARF